MKGVVFSEVGAQPKVVTDLPKPKAGKDQILVKSLYTAINRVDAFMAMSGILVVDWPLGLGCDAAGVVVEVGEGVSTFKAGDEVCGCTRLGSPGTNTVAEYYVMDASQTIPKPKDLTTAQAATVGVGVETAGLGLFYGLNIAHPDPSAPPKPAKDWVVILGGASSVGKFAIQLAKAAGYNVAASCSSKSFDMIKDLGAHPFDYKLSQADQIKEIDRLSSGEANRIFDAVAANAEFARAVWTGIPRKGERYYTTTNDWDPIEFEGVQVNQIKLGPIGRPEAKELNSQIAKIITTVSSLFEKGLLRPAEYSIQGEGYEGAIKAYEYQTSGKGGSTKVVVKVQDP